MKELVKKNMQQLESIFRGYFYNQYKLNRRERKLIGYENTSQNDGL